MGLGRLDRGYQYLLCKRVGNCIMVTLCTSRRSQVKEYDTYRGNLVAKSYSLLIYLISLIATVL